MHIPELVAFLLLLVGSFLNVAMIGLSREKDDDLPWRAKWMAQTRRHPLLRAATLACQLGAIVLFLFSILTYYT